jgi:hypothetical protein
MELMETMEQGVGDLRSGGAMGGTTLTIEGTATYGGFRRFSVDVTTIIR